MLGTLGEQTLVANGLKATRRGKLMAQLLGYITEGENGPELAADLPLVNRPKASMSVDPSFRMAAPGELTNGNIKFKAQCTPDAGTLQRTIVCLLAYNKDKNVWTSMCQAFVANGSNEVTLWISPRWAGDTIICYGYALGIVSNPAVAAVTSIGNLEGTTDTIGISVDSTGVAYGDLLYTQVYSVIEETSFPTRQ